MSTYIRKNALEFHIDLRNVHDERTFLMKMNETFSFPDYFGFTLDCLDDCMQSLEWIEHRHVLAKFYHLEDVKKHNETLYSEIVGSLNLYRSYWNGSTDKKVLFEY